MTDAMFRSVLKSQYHAALAMLREAVERCPADEWANADHKNAFWQPKTSSTWYDTLVSAATMACVPR